MAGANGENGTVSVCTTLLLVYFVTDNYVVI